MSEVQSVPAQSPGPAEGSAQGASEGSGRALVLSGGGIKGAYQIGAIVEVIERGIPADRHLRDLHRRPQRRDPGKLRR